MRKPVELSVEQQDKIIDSIIYGDIHETPLSILGDLISKDTTWLDDEQLTRVFIAATLKQIFEKGEPV